MFYNLILFAWSMFEFCVNISVILAIKLTEMIHVCISLHRSYQGWLLSVLLHIQFMERSGGVHGGSVCDARVQR